MSASSPRTVTITLDGTNKKTTIPLMSGTAGADVFGLQGFASDDAEQLGLAERLGAHPIETDLARPTRSYPIVVDAGVSPAGLA